MDTCEEVLLNKLLNEMDGLKEEADILFILTTNRPEALERALASRPGRVDQAIEFPLPDEEGREKLVRLYARGVERADDVVRAIVRRTEKVSAAFIKELMRRSVQFHLERNGDGCVSSWRTSRSPGRNALQRRLAEPETAGGRRRRLIQLGVDFCWWPATSAAQDASGIESGYSNPGCEVAAKLVRMPQGNLRLSRFLRPVRFLTIAYWPPADT